MTPAFDLSYVRLPERFFSRQTPTTVVAPAWIRLNRGLAGELGLDPAWLESPEGLAMVSGNGLPPGADPVAQAYAGHQFGHFVPQLGDGRAILIGEVRDRGGRRKDLVLKGAGRTAYSRGGDGRAALGPVLREYLVSEAMAALGVPTTRALAAVTTGETVWREDGLPGAIVTRVAASHVRVGTFQYFAARGDAEALRLLTAWCLERHYPERAEAAVPALALLEAVVAAQAKLVAAWMSLGFIHGVMNTDNVAISGETIDFGPCAFMDTFRAGQVFSSIDRHGRYAWGNQPAICQWNLTRLAEALLPVIDSEPERAAEPAQAVLAEFPALFQAAYRGRFRAKLGLAPATEPGEVDKRVRSTLEMMEAQEVDFTRFFRELTRAAGGADTEAWVALFRDPAVARDWLAAWRAELGAEGADVEAMRGANPVLIPRNHRIEQAIRAATGGDFGLFHRLADAWTAPFAENAELVDLESPPAPEERVTRTFCGT